MTGWCADWITFGHDPQRSGWASKRLTLSRDNASSMVLKWKTKLPNESYSLSALTAPVVASDVSTGHGVRGAVYVAGIGGTVFALDSETGEQLWTRTFKYRVQPGKGGYQGTFLCPNGITATPVIDKTTQILYVLAGDGALWGLDLGSGAIRYGPVQFVAPYAKAWSLNLVNGVVYTTLSQGCGAGLSGFYGVDVATAIVQSFINCCFRIPTQPVSGAAEGRSLATMAASTDLPLTATSIPRRRLFECRGFGLSPKLELLDYFLPLNWDYLRKRDLDLGSASAVYFGWKNRRLLATGTKESVVNLLDAESLGGADHQTSCSALRDSAMTRVSAAKGSGSGADYPRPAMTRARRGCTSRWEDHPPRVLPPSHDQWRDPARQHHGFQSGGRSPYSRPEAGGSLDLRRFQCPGPGSHRKWSAFRFIDR